MHKLCLIFLCLLGSFACKAQEDQYDEGSSANTETPDAYQLEQDDTDTTISLHIYLLSTDSQKAWKEARAYAYNKNLDTLLKTWKNKNKKTIAKSRYKRSTWFDNLLSAGVFKTILWLLAFGFVGYILFKLVLNKGLFERRIRTDFKPVEVDEEQNLDKNFDKLILEAESTQDHRSAIRFSFLKMLKLLNEAGLILYDKDKTNKHYLQELKGELKQNFAVLARFYEYAWYGHVLFNAEQYAEIKDRFTHIYSTAKR